MLLTLYNSLLDVCTVVLCGSNLSLEREEEGLTLQSTLCQIYKICSNIWYKLLSTHFRRLEITDKILDRGLSLILYSKTLELKRVITTQKIV